MQLQGARSTSGLVCRLLDNQDHEKNSGASNAVVVLNALQLIRELSGGSAKKRGWPSFADGGHSKLG